MEDRASRTVSRSLPRIALALAFFAAGCAGLYKAPRLLAGAGAVAVAGGSGVWAAGGGVGGGGGGGWAAGGGVGGGRGSSQPMVAAGFVSVVVGLAAIVAAGGWMA